MNNKFWRSSLVGFLALALVPYLVEAQALDGTGSLSGSVTAPSDFRAAKVFALNTDKQIQYMVYTAGGDYRAINLFPGNYEVRVEKSGFASDVHNVVVNEGQNATVDFSLSEASGGMPGAGAAELVPYDTLYPPGPGRVALEKNCTFCHNDNYLPSRQWTSEQWQLGVDLLLNVGGPRSIMHRPVTPGMPSLVALQHHLCASGRRHRDHGTQHAKQPVDRELILGYLTAELRPGQL